MSKYFCVCVSVHHMHVATTRPEEGLGPPGDGVPAAWSYHVGAGIGTWVRAVKHSPPPPWLYIFAGVRILHLTDWHASGIQIILTLSQGLKNNQIFQLGLCSASLIIVTVLGTHLYWPPWRKELDLQVHLVWGGGGETCACFSDSPEELWLYVFPTYWKWKTHFRKFSVFQNVPAIPPCGFSISQISMGHLEDNGSSSPHWPYQHLVNTAPQHLQGSPGASAPARELMLSLVWATHLLSQLSPTLPAFVLLADTCFGESLWSKPTGPWIRGMLSGRQRAGQQNQ